MSNSFARQERIGSIARIRAWIGLACLISAPIDVIDVFGFSFGFRLTPFLLLSALYVSTIIVEALATGPALPIESFAASEAAGIGLICLMGFSVLFLSYDPLGVAFARLVYTSWLVIFSMVFVNAERKSFPLTIVRCTRAFIVLDIVAVTLQFAGAIAGIDLPKYLDGLSIKDLSAFARPGGLSSDPNVASIMLVLLLGFSYFARDRLPQRKHLEIPYYLAGLTLACLAMSRTGTVAVGLLLLAMFHKSENKKKLLLQLCLASSVGVAYLVSTNATGQVAEAASQAFLGRDESNFQHFGVMLEGARIFFGDAKVFLAGSGWGTEYHYTKDFFQEAKYGNFHCTYLSFAVQGGFMSLLCLLFLLFRPLILRYPCGTLAVIFLWSGIFYQYHGDPLWWILLFALNNGSAPDSRAEVSLTGASRGMLQSHA